MCLIKGQFCFSQANQNDYRWLTAAEILRMCVCVSKQDLSLSERKPFLYSLSMRLLIYSSCSPVGKVLFLQVSQTQERPDAEWRRQGPAAWFLPPQCLPSGAWPGVWLLFIPAQVLSVFELALPAYMLEPQAVHEVSPRALKPMSWRLGRENVSLSFWVNSMFFSKRLDHCPQSMLARQNVTVTVQDILNF